MRSSGPCSTLMPADLMRSTSCSGTGSMTSVSPERSAATRVASLPIGVNTISSTLLSDLPHQLKFLTSTVRTDGWRSLSRNGPVPFALKLAVFSIPLRRSTGRSALLSSHHFLLIIASVVSVSGRIGYGAVVSISTARSPTLRTSLIGLV